MAISVRDLRKSYGDTPAVRGISFDVATSEVFGLLGATLCVIAVRDLMLGGNATAAVLGTLAWLVGLLLVFVPLAVGRYRALE